MLQLSRDELSTLLFTMAKLVDEGNTAELVVDLTITSPIVESYAALLGLDGDRALQILNQYGKFFMSVIDTKVQAAFNISNKKLIGSMTGGMDL